LFIPPELGFKKLIDDPDALAEGTYTGIEQLENLESIGLN